MSKKHVSLMPRSFARDPFAILRQMTSELDRVFEAPRWPSLFARSGAEEIDWMPQIEVFEKDDKVITRVDLPGLKKEDVKVEVADGYLAISGQRRRESEEKKEQFYRCEREYGSFYRAVPLPEGVKLEDVKATFSNGVLEVSVPIPALQAAKARTIEIQEPPKSTRSAA